MTETRPLCKTLCAPDAARQGDTRCLRSESLARLGCGATVAQLGTGLQMPAMPPRCPSRAEPAALSALPSLRSQMFLIRVRAARACSLSGTGAPQAGCCVASVCLEPVLELVPQGSVLLCRHLGGGGGGGASGRSGPAASLICAVGRFEDQPCHWHPQCCAPGLRARRAV